MNLLEPAHCPDFHTSCWFIETFVVDGNTPEIERVCEKVKRVVKLVVQLFCHEPCPESTRTSLCRYDEYDWEFSSRAKQLTAESTRSLNLVSTLGFIYFFNTKKLNLRSGLA